MGAQLRRPPAIFQVNWFRTGDDGRLLWPGFGQNLRVLLWMIERVKGKGAVTDAPIGLVPTTAALNWEGLDLSAPKRQALLRVDRSEWAAEVPEIRAFFEQFGDLLPGELNRALAVLSEQLTTASV
jgi:phosphoenolpyruvate carboxykinase (GTP)